MQSKLSAVKSYRKVSPLQSAVCSLDDDRGVNSFTLIVASWVIRARWREIRRFALEFKASYFFLNPYI